MSKILTNFCFFPKKDFTGLDAPFEKPDRPFLVIDTEQLSPEESVDQLFKEIGWLDWFFTNITQHGLSIFSNIVIFTFVFRYVHNGYVEWKVAIIGAVLTGSMLYLGQLLIKYYLFHYFSPCRIVLCSRGVLRSMAHSRPKNLFRK